MDSEAYLLRNYPNLRNRYLPLIGCVTDTHKEEAKYAFKRTCFKDVIIHDIKPLRKNCHPSCVWRVFYKMKGPTDFYEEGNSSNDVIYPFPDNDEQLEKMLIDITLISSAFMRLNVAQKGYIHDKTFAVVDYFSIGCSCPFQDFKSITDVTINLSNMKI